MSVQAGILHFDGAPANREALLRMSHSVCDFGSDAEMTHFSDSLGMLHRPFYTTPESRAEHQPLLFSYGRAMIWDGRLDNRNELLLLLGKSSPDAWTDIAIVVAAFERWDTDCFTKLIGDWAISIWDPRTHTLILARDYIGIKQLFYYLKPFAIMWCSHLAALAQCGDAFTICDEYIAGFLAFKPDACLSPYREIRSVPPGKFVCIKNAHVTTHAYWTFNPRLKTRYKTDAEYEEHYFHLLRQSVHRRLRTDAPILAALSGGLDSTSIVCMADDLWAKGEAATRQVDTVSYYDRSEPDEDDSYHLKKVEQKRGRKGFHLCLSESRDSLSFDYTSFIATPGFGMRDEIKCGMADLIRRGGYRVMLSGTGGDEMNAQALDPLIPIADLLAHLRFLEAGKQLVAWSLATRLPFIHLLFGALLELFPMQIRARLVARGRLQPWVDRHFARKYRMRTRQIENVEGVWFWRPGPRDAAQTIMTLSRDLSYSSPSRIEQRYPYLDQTLVEFLTSIPLEQLLRPGNRRSLMRRALSSLLPAEVLQRKTKVSAARCFSLTLEKHWDKVEQSLISSLSSSLGYVDGIELRADLLKLRNGQVPLHLVRLLKALSLEFWLRDLDARGILAIRPSSLVSAHTCAAFKDRLERDLTTDRHKKGGECHERILQTRSDSIG